MATWNQIIMIILLGIFSCSPDTRKKELDFHIKKINLMNSSIPLENWETNIYSFPIWEDDYKEFSVFKEEDDTLFYLSFGKFDTAVDYTGLQFLKVFQNNENEYHLTTNLSKDTIIFYYIPNNTSEKVFIIGKYKYLAGHMKMSYEQYLYYKIHKDSLSKIRGNDLPELPELCTDN